MRRGFSILVTLGIVGWRWSASSRHFSARLGILAVTLCGFNFDDRYEGTLAALDEACRAARLDTGIFLREIFKLRAKNRKLKT